MGRGYRIRGRIGATTQQHSVTNGIKLQTHSVLLLHYTTGKWSQYKHLHKRLLQEGNQSKLLEYERSCGMGCQGEVAPRPTVRDGKCRCARVVSQHSKGAYGSTVRAMNQYITCLPLTKLLTTSKTVRSGTVRGARVGVR